MNLEWTPEEKAAYLEEGRLTDHLSLYALNIKAERIPNFILDPMLGVDLSARPPVDADGE